MNITLHRKKRLDAQGLFKSRALIVNNEGRVPFLIQINPKGLYQGFKDALFLSYWCFRFKYPTGMSLILNNIIGSANNFLVGCPLLLEKTVHLLKNAHGHLFYSQIFFSVFKYFYCEKPKKILIFWKFIMN